MSMNFNWLIFSILFFMGLISYIINRKHLLCLLLSLEYMVLSIFIMMINYLIMFNNEFFFILMYMVFFVCEGVLGFSILVSIIRVNGNDYLQSFSLC
uniref:NADH dehydrogenase subunit 4L n=1 Tax=Brachytarsina amboinensis TaxID=3018683 RepID=UPI0023AA25A2|nr:NADH dehydrogenase subunit 4L [Brachytarsina amboinensis]WCL18793.1 NADH dehydrogenase subunit 4L [Brachytarsina amboinensis]WHN64468.1 NADH dehydrogenase subunit 4L [Brachytarsina amboinensis]